MRHTTYDDFLFVVVLITIEKAHKTVLYATNLNLMDLIV